MSQELEKTFGKVGEIYSSKLERDEHGHSKCFAFVHYRKYDDALKAIRVFNGKRLSHGGRGKVIYVGHYESKEVSASSHHGIRVVNSVP